MHISMISQVDSNPDGSLAINIIGVVSMFMLGAISNCQSCFQSEQYLE